MSAVFTVDSVRPIDWLHLTDGAIRFTTQQIYTKRITGILCSVAYRRRTNMR